MTKYLIKPEDQKAGIMEMTIGYYIAFRDPTNKDDLPYFLWWNAEFNRFFKKVTEYNKFRWEKIEEIRNEKTP